MRNKREKQKYTSWGVFDIIQIVYGGVVRTSEEEIRRAAERGLGIVARGTVRDYRDMFPGLFHQGELEDLLEDDEDRQAFLIRFALAHPSISTVLVGTASQKHLAANVQAAAQGPLSEDVCDEAKRLLASVGSQPGIIPAF